MHDITRLNKKNHDTTAAKRIYWEHKGALKMLLQLQFLAETGEDHLCHALKGIDKM